jgi:hypothetical protein
VHTMVSQNILKMCNFSFWISLKLENGLFKKKIHEVNINELKRPNQKKIYTKLSFFLLHLPLMLMR